MRDCPDPETLERSLGGGLTDPERSALETHTSACAGCRAQLAELRAQLDLLADMRGALPQAQQWIESLGPEPLPERIGELEVLGEVGRGGMGSVLRVRDPRLRRELALKLVHADERDLFEASAPTAQVSRKAHGRFLEEAQVTSQLAHPGIVPVHALGETEDGRPFFTMQLVEGRDLREIFALVEQGSEGWTRTRALSVVLRVCEAMSYAHSKGVIHRDLKPGNVMVGRFGEVYVMDWGVARVLGRKDVHDRRLRAQIDSDRLQARENAAGDGALFTMDGDVLGTPVYMAPEQAEGKLELVGERSDVYSVGALLYQLLAGTVPYVEPGTHPSGREVLRRVLAGPPRPLASFAKRAIPVELAAICEKAMGRTPGERYGGMLELGEDLRAFLEHRVVRAYETGAWAEFKKWVRRNRKLAASLALAGLAIVGGSVATAIVQSEAKRALELSGDVPLLSFLERRADELWPATPDRAPAMEEWLASAAAIESRRPRHEKKLARLAALGEIDAHQRRFLDELDAFLAVGGTRDAVAARLAAANTIAARTLAGANARAWSETVAAVRAHPRYGGLELAPQLGLVPLGVDPNSGLFEFTDLATGTAPQRRADGTLALEEASGIVFVLLPGGRFTMGSPAEAGARGWHSAATRDEHPRHEIELAPFFLAKHEMTQGQWQRAFGTNPSGYPAGSTEEGRARTLMHPVERLSWHDAATGMRRLGFELPTEAQWEYAVRAGTDTVWFTGDDMHALVGYLNVADKGTLRLKWDGAKEWPELDDGWIGHAPVDAHAPNPFGLHGMLGNVWEWCRDVLASYELPVAPGDGERTVENAAPDADRVYRGSSFKHAPRQTRSADRGGDPPWFRDDYMGVRPARAVTPH